MVGGQASLTDRDQCIQEFFDIGNSATSAFEGRIDILGSHRGLLFDQHFANGGNAFGQRLRPRLLFNFDFRFDRRCLVVNDQFLLHRVDAIGILEFRSQPANQSSSFFGRAFVIQSDQTFQNFFVGQIIICTLGQLPLWHFEVGVPQTVALGKTVIIKRPQFHQQSHGWLSVRKSERRPQRQHKKLRAMSQRMPRLQNFRGFAFHDSTGGPCHMCDPSNANKT